MRNRSRGQLLGRLKRYQKVSRANDTDDPLLRAYLDDAYARVWDILTGADAGFGQTRRDFVFATESNTLDLPVSFMHLRNLVINPDSNRVWPLYASDQMVSRLGLDRPGTSSGSRAIHYQVEGPGDDWDDGLQQLVPYVQRLRFAPALPATTVVRVTWDGQPPSLADTDGQYIDTVQDTTISVDVISEPLEEAIVGYARIWSSDRSDDSEYQRAGAALAEASDAYLATRANRNQLDADHPGRHQRPGSGGFSGY